jgi:hypothetical protein
MKKNKNKKFFLSKRFLSKFWISIWIIIFSLIWVYWIDTIWDYIKTQTSTWTWTNSNKITFSNKKTTYYINKNDDDILTWDKLRWYYYDNIYWYFRLDWSQTESNNVHITSTSSISIDSCNKWWKFSWKAYSKYMWYIDFNHTWSWTFVYYCEDDKKIYWNTNSTNLWKQNLNWIEINIREKQIIDDITQKVETQDDNNYIENTGSIQSTDNNWNDNNIGGWDKYEIEKSDIEELEWNVFWIIK